MPLDVGADAPTVTLPNQHDESVEVDTTGPTVLYFYPEDGTPGCTTEAEQFGRERETYGDAGVPVYGVSTDDVDSHAAFAADHDVWFDLLADPDGTAIDAYEVDRDARDRAVRTTFVLVDGRVHRVYEGVNPDGHAREVLLDLLEEGLVNF